MRKKKHLFLRHKTIFVVESKDKKLQWQWEPTKCKTIEFFLSFLLFSFLFLSFFPFKFTNPQSLLMNKVYFNQIGPFFNLYIYFFQINTNDLSKNQFSPFFCDFFIFFRIILANIKRINDKNFFRWNELSKGWVKFNSPRWVHW